MKFTFGICTYPGSKTLDGVIDSIVKYAPTSHIVVIGGTYINMYGQDFTYIPFDENVRKSWITKKKNLITHMARHQNIVYMHDYVELTPNWLDGFLKFGNDWDVCMNIIEEQDGKRHRDWVVWDDPELGHPGLIKEKWCPPDGLKTAGSLTPVPYDYNKTQYMYVSGAYWVAKKQFMLDCPFNEDLCWGEGEDVEWSYRARKTWNYKMNTLSTVRFNKPK